MIHLAQPATVLDATYDLIKLAPNESRKSPLYDAMLPIEDGPLAPGAPPGWLYESKVAEQVLMEMIAEANITVVTQLIGLKDANVSGTTLQSVTAENGMVLSGRVWIDGSYEGDLAYVGGADMVWGRESTAQYNETSAGRRPPSITYPIDPYWPDGSVIPHVSDASLVPVGDADDRIEV